MVARPVIGGNNTGRVGYNDIPESKNGLEEPFLILKMVEISRRSRRRRLYRNPDVTTALPVVGISPTQQLHRNF